jgi:hypothetical protein
MHGSRCDHNAFSKWLLEWITPQVRSSGSGAVTLAPSGTSRDALVVMPGASAGKPFSEYFVVQNRFRVGNDANMAMMPADGLLIWHVDAMLNATGTNFKYDNSLTSHKLLRLMEADGLEEIEKNLPGNAGDYYTPGASFGATTKPASSSYYSPTKTDVYVGAISWSGSSLNLTASVVGPPPVSSTSYVFSPNAASAWRTAAQSVTITVTGGSGAGRAIHFSANGGSTWSMSMGSLATVEVSAEGSHHFLYYATDSLATEAVHDAGWINIDKTAPTTKDDHLSVSLVAPATITLTPSDAGSGMVGGLARTEYKVDAAATYSVGTKVVLPAGTHTLAYRSTDAAGNRETPDMSSTVTVAAATSPVSASAYVFAADAVSGWHQDAQNVPLTASGGHGAGLAIHYSTDGGLSWTTAAAAVTVPVGAQGTHHFLFYASDSLATEAPHDAGWINIDGVAPVTAAEAVSVKRGSRATFKFRVGDGPPSCGSASVVVTISKGARTLKTLSLGVRGTNRPLTYAYRVGLPKGTYTYSVSARDIAGNATAKAASAKLVVT